MEDFHGDPYNDEGTNNKRRSLPVIIITLFSAALTASAAICILI